MDGSTITSGLKSDAVGCKPPRIRFCLSPTLPAFRRLAEVTATLGDGIILLFFLLQKKNVVEHSEWTPDMKRRQRLRWSVRTDSPKITRLGLLFRCPTYVPHKPPRFNSLIGLQRCHVFQRNMVFFVPRGFVRLCLDSSERFLTTNVNSSWFRANT